MVNDNPIEVIGEKAKEITFTMNTMQSNKATFTTEIVVGLLDAVILSTDSVVNVSITLEDYPDVVLYDIIGYTGHNYVPLRISPFSADGEQFNYSPVKWNLNDRLIVTVTGGLNAEVKFIMRLK